MLHAALLALAHAHQPLFPLSGFPAGASDRRIASPAKVAFYDAGNRSYELAWIAGQRVRVEVLVPAKLGAFDDDKNDRSVRVDMACDGAAIRRGTDAVYVPWLETRLQSVLVLVDTVMPSAGACNVDVSTTPKDAQFVLQAGTEDAQLGIIYGTGFPLYIMFVSAWQENYIYGYCLAIALAVVAIWHTVQPVGVGAWHKAASLVFVCTAISRAWHGGVAGLGTGFALAIVSLMMAAATLRASSSKIVTELLLVVAILLPTRAWLDVLCLGGAVLTTRSPETHQYW